MPSAKSSASVRRKVQRSQPQNFCRRISLTAQAFPRATWPDAQFLQEAGAFAIVLECVPAKLAAIVTEKLSIPTIGIGAGVECDGQILVYQDMLGMYQDFSPKFVKHFAEIGKTMKEAFDNYAKEVKDSSFPAVEHTFKIDDEILKRLY